MTSSSFERLRAAATDASRVSGLTHNFYRHPARFSPTLAATAIQCFSHPGALVLDPFMGGGTTLVEALANGRRVVGADINPLSVFVARAKTTPLRPGDASTIRQWAERARKLISYGFPREQIRQRLEDDGTRNLHFPRSRAIKKGIAIALESAASLPDDRTRRLARCVILRTAQWALDSKRRPTSLGEFRERLLSNAIEMLDSVRDLQRITRRYRLGRGSRQLLGMDARHIHTAQVFADSHRLADLVVTSPPYPGIHALYNRWQVDGHHESPAPYWITACQDGQGLSYYTFGDRRQPDLSTYFDTAAEAFRSLRSVMRKGAYLIQVLAFSQPDRQLDRYLDTMLGVGFEETQPPEAQRIWRVVPNRRWHAALRGATAASREVVLVHRAV